jgi:hypothetical protein
MTDQPSHADHEKTSKSSSNDDNDDNGMASFGRSFKPPSYLMSVPKQRPGMPGRTLSTSSEISTTSNGSRSEDADLVRSGPNTPVGGERDPFDAVRYTPAAKGKVSPFVFHRLRHDIAWDFFLLPSWSLRLDSEASMAFCFFAVYYIVRPSGSSRSELGSSVGQFQSRPSDPWKHKPAGHCIS